MNGGLIFYGSLIGIPIIIGVIMNYKENKCVHGIHNGRKIVNMVCKCPQCEAARQSELLHKQEMEEKRQEEIRKRRELAEKQAVWVEQYNVISDIIKRKAGDVSKVNETQIRAMGPFEFEDYIARLFRELGYEVVQTPKVNDRGKDAYARKNGQLFLIECKHYAETATIGRPLLQKLFAAMVDEKAKGGIYISTCNYTKEAVEYAANHNIELVDMTKLMVYINKATMNAQEYSSYAFVLPCVRCGDTVRFIPFDRTPSKQCKNGHTVYNPLTEDDKPNVTCEVCGYNEFYYNPRGMYGAYYKCKHCGKSISKQRYIDMKKKSKH